MYKNYEKRVKDFVLDMTNPETIIEYKDITEKITNTRIELINEQFANNPENRTIGIIQKGANVKAKFKFLEAVAIDVPIDRPHKAPNSIIPIYIIYFLKVF